MKINNFYISSFGKLEGAFVSFDPGMNVITGDNEFGKSTMLSFLRAMFYGFSQRGSVRIRDNDRKKFAPWNGKPFGGAVEFQNEGKTYLLEKSFSSKRAEDKTSLTLLPSGQKIDLVQKEVGEYLFGISEAEFVNTVFVGQLSSNILNTQKETEDISARLANLADAGSEIFSYDEIKTRLINASSKLLALRGTGGLIPRIEEELAELEEKQKELETAEEQSGILRREIDLSLEKQKNIEGEISACVVVLDQKKAEGDILQAEMQQREVLVQTALQKKKMDQEQAEVKADYEKTRREHLLQREQMLKQISEESAGIEEEISRLEIQYSKDRHRAAALAAEMEDQLSKEIALCRENKALYDNKALETQNLEEEILSVSSEIKTLIQTREEMRKGLTTIIIYKIHARKYQILFLTALTAGLGAFFFLREPAGLGGIIFGIFAGVIQIMNYVQRRRIEKEIVEKNLTHEAKLKVYENAAAFLFDSKTSLSDCGKRIDELRMQKLHLEENLKKDEQYREKLQTMTRERLYANRARSAQLAVLSEESTKDGPEPELQSASLAETAEGQIDTEFLHKQLQSDKRRLEGIRELISLTLKKSEQLKTDLSLSCVDTARKEVIRESLLSAVTDRSRILEQRSLLTDRLKEAKAYHRSLMTAKGVLEEAFSEMENFFAPQVNERAGEYLAKLTEGVYTTLHVDRSFGIDIASEGSYSFHRADFFSGGTVDQIYLALRLGIADLIGPSADKMPLLLDDTLVQYDEKRAKAGLVLLDELSLHRQIVLFTCHARIGEMYAEIIKDKGSRSE